MVTPGMYGEGITYESGMTILQKSHGYTTGSAMKLSHQERVSFINVGKLVISKSDNSFS